MPTYNITKMNNLIHAGSNVDSDEICKPYFKTNRKKETNRG